MKSLLLFGAIALSINVFGQSSCFSSKDDVKTYVIWKSFESKDGNMRLEFGPSRATLKAGSKTFNYMYDRFSYLGSGHKGLVTMTNLSGGGVLKMYVSCKERMMTDNGGTLLYEAGTGGNSASEMARAMEEYKRSSENSSSGNTVKIGYLEVMTKDLGEMEGDEAKKACAALGDGWRLPTKAELNTLYKNKDKIGGFASGNYWSSTESGNFGFAWGQNFSNGYQDGNDHKHDTYYVRAVRAFSSSATTIKIGNLEVMFKDLGEMDWDEAKKACAALGDGWRLPTKAELNTLYKNKDKIGGFAKNYYWSSTVNGNLGAWVQGFGNGRQTYLNEYNDFSVRAVRAF